MNTSDQHSSSESSTTTMTGSTDQANAAQLEFELAWETRDEIFRNLNEHTKLLSGLIIKPDARETMRKANVDLMATLMHLPLKVDGRSRSSESLQRSADDGPTNELLLDLSSDVKSRIVDTLITNHAVLLDADFVTSQFKSKLIDRNNDLASELLKLRSRAVSINSPVSEGDHLISQTKASESQSTSKVTVKEERLDELNDSERSNATLQQQNLVEQPVTGQTASSPTTEEVANLKEELQQLKTQVSDQLGKQISDQGSVISGLDENVRGLKRKLDESKGELDKLKVRIGEVDVCRDKATFTFVLKGIEVLLAGLKYSEVQRSELFYCKGIPWFISANRNFDDGVAYLSVNVMHNSLIDKDHWTATATVEIRLLSSSPLGGDVVRINKDCVFMKPNAFTSCGWNKFITIEKLRSGPFIQNDTIKIRAHLTVHSFERFVTN